MTLVPVLLAAVVLVENGVAKFHFDVAEKVDPAVEFGVREIAKYFRQVSGCGEFNGGLVVKVAEDSSDARLKEDGFVFDVTSDGVAIVGANPRGALYGCYELVKRAAGVRWLLPGEDGEYVPKRPTLTLPEGRQVCNPYLAIRECRGGCKDLYLWAARNNLLSTCSRKDYGANRYLRELAVRPAGNGMGHILTNLMLGWVDKKERLANAERLFAVHPEYFPLKKGKRVKIDNALSPNPCVSNPELVEIMATNLWEAVKGRLPGEDYLLVGNNDTTEWCECDACKALDAPEAKGTKGERSDRYWHLLNELGKRIWAKDPKVKLSGWAYQNFWYPPRHVKIDPRFKVVISFNNQCWRHAITDTNCIVNTEFRRILAAWKATGHPLVVNRDEIGATGSPGSTYAPAEMVFVKNARAYPSLGLNGSHLCTNVPENPPFLDYAKKKPPYYGKNYRWYAIWQTVYLAANVMWNREADIRALYDEANRLYYGAGWEAGFRDYQKTRTRAFLSTPGCIGWGEGASIAPTTAKFDVMDRMRRDLSAALAAVEKAGDERSRRHLLRDREIFEATWGVANSNLLAKAEAFGIFPGGFGASDSFRFRDIFVTGTYALERMTLRMETTNGRLCQTDVTLAFTGEPGRPIRRTVRFAKGAGDLVLTAKEAGRRFLGGGTWRITVEGRTADVKLGEKRPQGIWNQGTDSTAWKNATFTARKELVPQEWGGPLAREGCLKEENGNWYAALKYKGDTVGIDQQFIASHVGPLSVTFRARGKGMFRAWCGAQKGSWSLTDAWQTFTWSYDKKTADERPSVHFAPAKDSTADLDDVYVNPEEVR